MIIDEFPELKSLTPEIQLELAAELIELTTGNPAKQPDQEVVAALNERLEQYRKNPESVSSLKSIRGRILKEIS